MCCMEAKLLELCNEGDHDIGCHFMSRTFLSGPPDALSIELKEMRCGLMRQQSLPHRSLHLQIDAARVCHG